MSECLFGVGTVTQNVLVTIALVCSDHLKITGHGGLSDVMSFGSQEIDDLCLRLDRLRDHESTHQAPAGCGSTHIASSIYTAASVYAYAHIAYLALRASDSFRPMADHWILRIGGVELGSLTPTRTEGDWNVCQFEPTAEFARYAAALAPGDLSEGDDHLLDTVIDEIAIEGIWLTTAEGDELVDPAIQITGSSARFKNV